MKKAPAPTKTQGAFKNTEQPKSNKPAHFLGTENPRHLRAIMALLTRARTREDVDRTAGCSNGPELIAELRRRGLDVPCSRTPCIDRDGFEVKRGIYHFTDRDKRLIRAWLKRRDRQRKQGGRHELA
jgi:hypothetical protein